MTDDTQRVPPSPTGSNSDPTPAEQPAPPPLKFNIGEEFGTPDKNLPSLKIVAIVVVVIAIIAGLVAFIQKPRQKATGTIDNVVAVEIPNQNQVMVSIELSIHNAGEKAFLPRDVKADIETANGTLSDQAASAIDFPRYVQAFPTLAGNGTGPLQFEKPVPPGGDAKGTIIVDFPVTAEVFAQRKLLRLTLSAPDQLVPLVITK